MRGYTHVAASITLLTFIPATPSTIIGLMLGSLLPDIDADGSTITRILPKIPIEHRTITHSFLALVAMTVVAAIFSRYFALGMFFGYLSHLLLDSLNPTGVPFFYPFIKIKYRFSKIRIRTGSILENVLLVVLLIVDFLILSKVANNLI